MKEWAHKVAGKIGEHQHLLDVLPTGDKYFSILTGGLTACIKVGDDNDDIASYKINPRAGFDGAPGDSRSGI